MPADGILEPLDVVEHIRSRVVLAPVDRAPDPLGLERGEEALLGGIVPDVARSSHRALHAIVGHQSLELFAGKLAALIRVVE